MRKLLALTLAMALVVSLSVSTLAANSFDFSNKSGTLNKISDGPFIKFPAIPNEFREGYETSITFNLDPAKMTHGEFFEYTVGINGTAESPSLITEVVIRLLRVKSGSVDGIIWDKCGAQVPRETVLTKAGEYTVTHKFVDNEGKLRGIVTLSGPDVNKTITIDEFSGSNGTPTTEACGFARYMWFPQSTIQSGLEITNWSAPEFITAAEDNGEKDYQQKEAAAETAKTEAAKAVEGITTVMETIDVVIAPAGTSAADELAKACQAAGLKMVTVEVEGVKTVAPVVKLDVVASGGQISYRINDMISGTGLFIEFVGSDGKTYIIPTSSLKKSEPNRIFYTEAYLIGMAIK